MNNLRLNFSGVALSRLRALVEAVAEEVRLVTGAVADGASPTPKSALAMTWSNLAEMLDLGTEPEMLSCPHCHGQCMAGATRCGNCWASLPAMAPQPTTTAEMGDGQGGRRRAAA
jgi:hypothetical protein